MKSSHIALICVAMPSLFALHECVRMDVRETESPNNKIDVPTCYHGPCHPLVTNCWCCEHLHHCWSGKTGQSYCNEQCKLMSSVNLNH
ncbi:hypothetical protein EUTSA_v10009981mg [Eutrema salsugineum]|uniref:Embryo surrounding factor 1 brassicaceae domain-containing protein n=1 Tax=Eutrema salsugineum TaxID=72664 RepID=V4MUR5_EUTSA|nr:hypothetical protein EUTSA_v10009981mg [Eutrema salsugineum]